MTVPDAKLLTEDLGFQQCDKEIGRLEVHVKEVSRGTLEVASARGVATKSRWQLQGPRF